MHTLHTAIQTTLRKLGEEESQETADQPTVLVTEDTMKMAVTLTEYFQDQRRVYEEVCSPHKSFNSKCMEGRYSYSYIGVVHVLVCL